MFPPVTRSKTRFHRVSMPLSKCASAAALRRCQMCRIRKRGGNSIINDDHHRPIISWTRFRIRWRIQGMKAEKKYIYIYINIKVAVMWSGRPAPLVEIRVGHKRSASFVLDSKEIQSLPWRETQIERRKERKRARERERERERSMQNIHLSLSIKMKRTRFHFLKKIFSSSSFFFWPREDSIEFNYLDCNLSKRKEDVVREEAGNNNIEGKKKIMWMQLKMEMSQIYGGLSVWFLLFRAELSGGLAAIYWQFHRRLFLISTRSDCRWKITWLPASTRL